MIPAHFPGGNPVSVLTPATTPDVVIFTESPCRIKGFLHFPALYVKASRIPNSRLFPG